MILYIVLYHCNFEAHPKFTYVTKNNPSIPSLLHSFNWLLFGQLLMVPWICIRIRESHGITCWSHFVCALHFSQRFTKIKFHNKFWCNFFNWKRVGNNSYPHVQHSLSSPNFTRMNFVIKMLNVLSICNINTLFWWFGHSVVLWFIAVPFYWGSDPVSGGMIARLFCLVEKYVTDVLNNLQLCSHRDKKEGWGQMCFTWKTDAGCTGPLLVCISKMKPGLWIWSLFINSHSFVYDVEYDE